jgi:serine/threonine-protein kinase RsbW
MTVAADPMPMTHPQPQVRIELRSNPLFLSGVRELVGAVAKRFGFPDEIGGQIALAVDEALCNVIRHGYQKQPDKPIWLSIWAEGGAWEKGTPAPSGGIGDERPDAMKIVIEDEAQQVEPAQIRSRNLDEIRPGGLGVHIIKTVMDQAVYEKRGSRGMRLTMIKKRNGPGTDGSGVRVAGGGCGCSGGSGGGSEACHG